MGPNPTTRRLVGTDQLQSQPCCSCIAAMHACSFSCVLIKLQKWKLDAHIVVIWHLQQLTHDIVNSHIRLREEGVLLRKTCGSLAHGMQGSRLGWWHWRTVSWRLLTRSIQLCTCAVPHHASAQLMVCRGQESQVLLDDLLDEAGLTLASQQCPPPPLSPDLSDHLSASWNMACLSYWWFPPLPLVQKDCRTLTPVEQMSRRPSYHRAYSRLRFR